MTSHRTIPSRRRSLSSSSLTSSSPLPRRSPEGSWRVAAKRAHHAHLPFNESITPPRKWDVEFWRRTKRARRDTSPSREAIMVDFMPSNTSIVNGTLRSYSSPANPAFASTPEDFLLYPKHSHRKREPSHPTRPVDAPSDIFTQSDIPVNDLTHLRSLAFGELQRSVAENGEGLVRRMRDFEDSRSKSGIFSKATGVCRRGRKGRSLHSWSRGNLGHTSEPDDDEDIQIFAGDTLAPAVPRQKRAASLGMMDLDTYHGDVLSSPGAACSSPHSADIWDDESLHADTEPHLDNDTLPPSPCISPSAISFTPALSHTYSTSANSSLTSLPLPPPFSNAHNSESRSPMSSLRSGISMAVPSSRSEKAIAALTLAMANGAGGLNDYETLRAIYQPPASDECEVGGLWH